MSMSLHEVEKLQALYPDYQIELRVGMLIDPDTYTVRVYRFDRLSKHADGEEPVPQVITLHNGETLTIPELFPGLEIPITSLWPSVYE